MSSFSRHLQRIRSQGIGTSLKYYLGTAMPGRFGCSLFRVVRAGPDPHPPNGAGSCRLLLSWDDLSSDDRGALQAYGGQSLFARISGRFSRGDRAVSISLDGALAGILWLSFTDRYPLGGSRQFIVENVFTLPKFRGRGLMRQGLLFARGWSWEYGHKADLVAEISFANTSSLRSFANAGFGPVGWRLVAGKWSRYWPRRVRV